MHECRRDMGFFDWRMNILRTTAANAINKVCVVVPGRFARWPWCDFIRQPSLVGVVAVDGQVAIRSIEKVADGIRLRVLWPQGLLFVTGFLFRIGGQSCGRHAAGSIGA